MQRTKGGSHHNYPWEQRVLLSDDDKRFLEDLNRVRGGIGISPIVREIIREKKRLLEDPTCYVQNESEVEVDRHV